MRNRIKRYLLNSDYKRLMSNLSYMAFIQIANYVLPFITLPYIVRTVGVDKFGIVVFAYTFVAYFKIVIDYGFKMIGAKNISVHRNDNVEVGRVFFSIISAQLILLLLSSIVFFITLFSFSKLYEDMYVFLFTYISLFGYILFPIWFFQGMEEMKYIAFFNIFSRLIYTISIFLVVKNPDDYIYIALLDSLSIIAIGLVSFFYIIKRFKPVFYFPTFNDLKELYISGWYLFISNIAVSLYSYSNILLLGIIADYKVVGVYALADKIFRAIIQILRMYNQVIYPHLAKYQFDKETLIYKTKKFLKIFVSFLAFCSVMLFILSDFFINLVYGSGNDVSSLVLSILSISIVSLPLGGFFTQYLIISNREKDVAKVTFKTMLLNFVYVVPLIYFYGAIGLAISVVLISFTQVYLNSRCAHELFSNESVIRRDK